MIFEKDVQSEENLPTIREKYDKAKHLKRYANVYILDFEEIAISGRVCSSH